MKTCFLRAASAVLAMMLLVGCPAVYPELSTRLKPATAAEPLDPPPPENLRWLKFVSARVPPKARDGRNWDQVLGSLPDPYAKLFVNGKEILRTPAQSDTLEPTWPDGPRGNFPITPDDKLRVELWDSSPINDKPIGVRDIGHATDEMRLQKQIRVELEGGGAIVLALEPAHALYGIGLWYEMRTDSCYITRLLQGSPAERSGVERGDEVLKLGGMEVKLMTVDEIRSAFNAVPAAGLSIVLKRSAGAIANVTLREGPIYAPYDQYGAVD